VSTASEGHRIENGGSTASYHTLVPGHAATAARVNKKERTTEEARPMLNRKFLLAVLVLLIAAFFLLDLQRFISLDYLKSQQAELNALYASRPLLVITTFFFGYIAVTALSLPGAAILPLAAGAQVGLPTGTIIVSFASSIGATLAFLASRYLFRDSIEHRFGDRLKTFNRNIEKDGAFYLFHRP
jgi:uncharacterized membrane protein YdjX (TVP38/TMEM64 family)